MKPIFDLFQIGLSLPGPLAYLAALALAWLALVALRISRRAMALSWSALRFVGGLVGMSKVGLVCLMAAALPVYLLRGPLVDNMQYMEQIFTPAYISGDTSAHALALYEAELEKHCDTYEAAIVKRRTREMATKIGCAPLALYEVAHSECGLNPFCIRGDGVAAGWIQFTSAGLGFVPGVTLPQVKQACKDRDVEKIMQWTEIYLVGAAGGKPITDATDVYVAVFAPGYVGADDGQVLYSAARDGAKYWLNVVFDGYYVDGKGRIICRESAKDGRITVGELRLHLEAKKARLLKSKI